MAVLDRVVQVIDVLGAASGPMRLGTIAEELSLPKSSTHRLLSELTGQGLVRRAGEGEYALGFRLVQWGRLADRSIGVRAAAEPVMTRLRDEVRESVHLYVAQEDHRVCVLSVEGPHTLRPVAVVGVPMPLGYGAAGKLLLAHAGERVLAVTQRTIPTHRGRPLPDAAALQHIRDTGFAVSIGEMEDGLTAIAAAIPSQGGGVHAALTVAAATSRLPETRHPEVQGPLGEAARQIGAALGG